VTTDNEPAYSPNRKKIAFQTHRNGSFQIYAMYALDGSIQKCLTQNDASDESPDWGVASP
jgi:Tol biopolymer transport system component